MALTTYAELKTAIAGWLDVSAASLSSQIDDLITIGERRIFREARTREMETQIIGTMNNGTFPVPSGYVAMKYLYINTSPVQSLERRSAEWINQNYPFQSSSGIPLYFARDGANFIFGPFPDSQYNLKGMAFARLIPLVTAVNQLYVSAPDLYLMACLAEADLILGRDSRIPLWEAKYGKILIDVNGEYKTEESSGSTLQMRVSTTISNRRASTYPSIGY